MTDPAPDPHDRLATLEARVDKLENLVCRLGEQSVIQAQLITELRDLEAWRARTPGRIAPLDLVQQLAREATQK